MGAGCSRDRMRCLMRVEAFLSALLFLSSAYMFFMVGYFSSRNRKVLPLIFGVLGGLILVGGIVTTSYAVSIWMELRKDRVREPETPGLKVRFSSLVEVHESGGPDSGGQAGSDSQDHDYEEIVAMGGGASAEMPHLYENYPEYKLSNSQQAFSQLSHLSGGEGQQLHYENLNWKVYLENGIPYGTFQGSCHGDDIIAFEDDDVEEIII